MTEQDLIAVLMPDGTILLEWRSSEKVTDKSRQLLQEEIYRRFADGSSPWCLFLGFADRAIPLSPSLGFWRRFAALFTEKLARTPDIETLRHRVTVPLLAEEIGEQLERAPMMIGADYLTPAILTNWWKTLHDDFAEQIRGHRGSVAEFIRNYSPKVHLVGRVFFTWWKTKPGVLLLLSWRPIPPVLPRMAYPVICR